MRPSPTLAEYQRCSRESAALASATHDRGGGEHPTTSGSSLFVTACRAGRGTGAAGCAPMTAAGDDHRARNPMSWRRYGRVSRSTRRSSVALEPLALHGVRIAPEAHHRLVHHRDAVNVPGPLKCSRLASDEPWEQSIARIERDPNGDVEEPEVAPCRTRTQLRPRAATMQAQAAGTAAGPPLRPEPTSSRSRGSPSSATPTLMADMGKRGAMDEAARDAWCAENGFDVGRRGSRCSRRGRPG